MPSTVLLIVALFSAAGPVDDAARVEQLMHRTPAQAATAGKPNLARNTNKPDRDAALLGQKVRVRTVDGGLYGGTLQSVDSAAIVLRIDLPKQTLNYSLPRSGVSGIESAASAP